MKKMPQDKSKPALPKTRTPKLCRQSILNVPFKEMIKTDEALAAARAENASDSPEERRMSADFIYNQGIAEDAVGPLMGRVPNAEDPYRAPLTALAIDPTYASAILTVGTLEYELNRHAEAMELLMSLVTLPEDTEELAEIIDEAGIYLIEAEDLDAALKLYKAAAAAYPTVAAHHNSVSYCLGKLGRMDEATTLAQRAVDLDPQNYLWWNDLGWSLFEAGQLEEAEKTLVRAVELSPPDYECARNNLEEVRDALLDAKLNSEKSIPNGSNSGDSLND